MAFTLISVPYVSFNELVTFFATEVCTAGIENTSTKTINNSKMATIILPNILKNLLM